MNIPGRSYAVIVVKLLLTVFADAQDVEDPVLWKLLFQQYRRWTGSYNFNNIPYACNLKVHHVDKSPVGTARVSFLAEGTRMDVIVSSKAEVVIFKKETSYLNSDRFMKSDPFEIETVFTKVGAIWTIIGNITHPSDRGFQTVKIHAMADRTETSSASPSNKDKALSMGLAVGIPVTLAIILMITGLAIGYWAVKKGYLRHVPRSYKNFRNPRTETPPVSFEPSQPTVHM